mgnify:CR=1 FL=1
MSRKKLPSKKKIEDTKAELEQLAIDKKQITERENELRIAIADALHHGEDGTENFEIEGYEIKVTRKMGITLSKSEAARLEDENEELYEEIMDHKVALNASRAKKRVDDLGDYVTLKQGLPTIAIKPIA